MMWQRILGVFKLDAPTFEAIEHDESATTQAAIVVGLVGLLSAIGVTIGAVAANNALGSLQTQLGSELRLLVDTPTLSPIEEVFKALVSAFVTWLVWSFLTYFIGTRLFDGEPDVDETLRGQLEMARREQVILRERRDQLQQQMKELRGEQPALTALHAETETELVAATEDLRAAQKQINQQARRQMLRVIGYAQAPRLLSALSFIPCLGGILIYVGWIWALMASFVAVRQGLHIDTGKTALTVILSFIVVVLVNLLILGPLFALLT